MNIETEIPECISLWTGGGSFSGFIRSLNLSLKANQYDIVHFHAPFSTSIALLYFLLKRIQLQGKTVYTVHNSFSRYNAIHLLQLLFIFLRIDKIVHCSQSSYESFSTKLKDNFLVKRTTISNGVNLDFVNRAHIKQNSDACINSERVVPEHTHKLVTIGRLVPVKNHSLLLQSLNKIKHSNFKLKIIGTGPLRDQLESEAMRLNIHENIEFTGAIPRDEVYRYLAESDLYISTSTLEGLPLSVLESLACGCPVVLSDIPSHAEIRDKGGIVKVVNSNDLASFVHAIDSYLSLGCRQKLLYRTKGKEHVARNHSMAAMNTKYLSLYHELITP